MSEQLQMIWPEDRLDDIPHVELSDEYALRTFQPGDEQAYIDLMRGAGFDNWDGDTLSRTLNSVLPDGLLVGEHVPTGRLVITAMATHKPAPLHPFGGELSWVAGDPQHAGRKLGRAICAAVLQRFADAGYRRIYLKTDDIRLAAIRVYFKLGWVPYLFTPEMGGRWRDVCATLDEPFEPDAWIERVGGTRGEVRPPTAVPPPAPCDRVVPVFPGERPDDDRFTRYPKRFKWLANRRHRGYPGGGDVDAFGDESLYKPSLLGSATAEPAEVQAGATSPLRLIYTAGPAGLLEGTRVNFYMRGQKPLGRTESGYELQSPAGCEIVPDDRSQMRGFAIVGGELAPGESVTMTAAPFEWTPLAGRREFKVVLHYADDRPEQRLPEPVVVEVLPLAPHRLEAIAPPMHRPGEPIDVRITARDRFDNRAPVDGPVNVHLAGSERTVQLVDGLATAQVEPVSDEPTRVSVVSESPRLVCESNPSVAGGEMQMFIGDLHCHDYLSEAEGYPDALYRWAIDDKRLDFVSVVPQQHGWLDNETWTLTKYMNERYLAEGRFVPLPGFEWQHTGYGDKVVHYLGGDQPVLPVDDPRYTSPEKLYAALRDSDALVIAHHPSYLPGIWCGSTDYESAEPDVERLVELWSMHGSSEGFDGEPEPLPGRDETRTAMAALKRGARFGFVGGSDTHSARPGGSAKEPRDAWGGLAGVWARSLTRRGIFEALRARRTVALTGARIVLKMTVNDAWMGEEIAPADEARIRVDVWAPGQIATVQIIKNAELLETYEPGANDAEIELADATGGPAFYHCRVTQTDGQLAVCSPVWVG